MTDDLVKRLRSTTGDACRCGTPVCLEAADRIEMLDAELADAIGLALDRMMQADDEILNRIEKLEAALIDILKVPRSEALWGIALVIARHALKEGKDG